MSDAKHPTFVYPRLPLADASTLLAQLRDQSLSELRQGASLSHPSADYYPTAARVLPDRLRELTGVVRCKADDLGFPGPCRQVDQRRFDVAMPALLHQYMRIVPADAANGDVWSFLTLVVLPDVAFWRFPNPPDVRLLGRPRNVFRRYWWRAHVLGAEDGGLAARLGEDQHVQIEERRAAIGGNPPLARALARTVLAFCKENPGVGLEPLMREAAKRLVRLTPFVCFEALPEEGLDAQIGEMVREAAAALPT